MARVAISTGTTPNDGTGDNLRAAGGKINSNFDDLYGFLGDGTNLTPSWIVNSVGIVTTAHVGIGTTNPRFQLEIGKVGSATTTLHVDGDVRVTGNVVSVDGQLTSAVAGLSTTGHTVLTTVNASGIVTAANVSTGGSVTAGSFYGDGQNLTGVLKQESDTLSSVVARGSSAGAGINFGANQPISFDTASNNDFQIYGSSNQKAYITHVQNNGGGGAGDVVIVARNGINLYGGTQETAANLGLEVVSGYTNLYHTGGLKLQTTDPGVSIFGTAETEQLSVTGVSTFIGDVSFGSTIASTVSFGSSTFVSFGSTATFGDDDKLKFGDNENFEIYHDGTNSVISETGTGNLLLGSDSNVYLFKPSTFESMLRAEANGPLELYYDGSKKFETTGAGVIITGVCTATSFSGDGSGLTGITASGSGIVVQHDGSVVGTAGTINFGTNLDVTAISAGIVTVTASGGGGGGINNLDEDTTPQLGGNLDLNGFNITGSGTIPAANLTGALPAIDGSALTGIGTASSTITWTLGADGSSHYTFAGIGITADTTNDPTIFLQRGATYAFVNNSGGSHPFRIQHEYQNTGGQAYNVGVTNNGASNGTITFQVPMNAPNKLHYQCTSHVGMSGTIFISPENNIPVGQRTVISKSTGNVGAGSSTIMFFDGFKSYGLLKVAIDHPAWITLYVDGASRTSDNGRSYLTDPDPGSGVIAEVRSTTSGSSTFLMSPGVIGWNNDSTPSEKIYARVTNNDNTTRDITVDLTVIKMEG